MLINKPGQAHFATDYFAAIPTKRYNFEFLNHINPSRLTIDDSRKVIYNVTTSVAHAVHESWLQWMLDEHLPEVLGTGCFERHQMVRLLDIDDTEGPTYAVQYYAISQAKYNHYQELYGNELRKKVSDRWGNNITSFRTLMELVNG